MNKLKPKPTKLELANEKYKAESVKPITAYLIFTLCIILALFIENL